MALGGYVNMSDVGSMKPCDHEGCVEWKELEALEQVSFVAFLPAHSVWE